MKPLFPIFKKDNGELIFESQLVIGLKGLIKIRAVIQGALKNEAIKTMASTCEFNKT